MRDFGETDDKKRTIRINVKKSKEYGRKNHDKATIGGTVANTIEHEILHAKRVGRKDNTEDKVWKKTSEVMRTMPTKQKNKLYKLVN